MQLDVTGPRCWPSLHLIWTIDEGDIVIALVPVYASTRQYISLYCFRGFCSAANQCWFESMHLPTLPSASAMLSGEGHCRSFNAPMRICHLSCSWIERIANLVMDMVHGTFRMWSSDICVPTAILKSLCINCWHLSTLKLLLIVQTGHESKNENCWRSIFTWPETNFRKISRSLLLPAHVRGLFKTKNEMNMPVMSIRPFLKRLKISCQAASVKKKTSAFKYLKFPGLEAYFGSNHNRICMIQWHATRLPLTWVRNPFSESRKDYFFPT